MAKQKKPSDFLNEMEDYYGKPSPEEWLDKLKQLRDDTEIRIETVEQEIEDQQ